MLRKILIQPVTSFLSSKFYLVYVVQSVFSNPHIFRCTVFLILLIVKHKHNSFFLILVARVGVEGASAVSFSSYCPNSSKYLFITFTYYNLKSYHFCGFFPNPYHVFASPEVTRIYVMVARVGVEPTRPCGQGILSPSCIPVSPPRHNVNLYILKRILPSTAWGTEYPEPYVVWGKSLVPRPVLNVVRGKPACPS